MLHILVLYNANLDPESKKLVLWVWLSKPMYERQKIQYASSNVRFQLYLPAFKLMVNIIRRAHKPPHVVACLWQHNLTSLLAPFSPKMTSCLKFHNILLPLWEKNQTDIPNVHISTYYKQPPYFNERLCTCLPHQPQLKLFLTVFIRCRYGLWGQPFHCFQHKHCNQSLLT